MTIPSIPRSTWILWLVLALPAALLLAGYLRDTLVYGEIVHSSGEFGARLLIVTMAATPLCLMFPGTRLPQWLMRHRRHFGVASFCYVLLHAWVYVARQADIGKLIDDAREAGMWTGWAGFVLLLLLAATSNSWSVRLLQRAWKRLHRLVYAAAILSCLHWVLVAFDRTAAIVHFAILGTLEGYRVWKVHFSPRRAASNAPERTSQAAPPG
jgi:methionine sulfoxide reductase heme-binding subunit